MQLTSAISSGTMSAFKAVKGVVEFCLRLISPLFVLLAAMLICFVVYVHFVGILPFYNGKVIAWTLPGMLHMAISIWLVINIVFNYISVVFTNPGSPPGTPSVDLNYLETQKPSDAPKICKTCKIPKSERAHHCHVCGRCILKMDHHCPWIANCVGFRNHHYFVMFLFYLALGTGYAGIMAYKPFLIATNFREPWEGLTSRSTVVFSGVLTISLFVAILILLSWQTYLILTGQTSIEFYINKQNERTAKRNGMEYKNPYDLGVKKNFQHFFGQHPNSLWFKWLLPTGPQPVGDGIHWPTVQKPAM